VSTPRNNNMAQVSENTKGSSQHVPKSKTATDNIDDGHAAREDEEKDNNDDDDDLEENEPPENNTDKNSARAAAKDEGTDNASSSSSSSAPPKNTRMKGYLVIGIVSIVNYAAADVKEDGKLNAVFNVRDKTQRGLVLVMVASMLSLVLCSFMVLIGLDRFTRLQRYWKRVFRPGGKIELCVLVFLVMWWIVFTIITTNVSGVAGAGSRLYNIYLATWICLITSFWTLERWVVSAGYMTSFYDFMMESPNRSAGWMALGIASILNLLFYVDTQRNWDKAIINLPDVEKEKITEYFESIYSNGQSEWVTFLTACTAIVSIAFILVEIFRNNSGAHSEQPEIEIKMEGIMLFLGALCWVPTVIFVTTIGGVANDISNIYFFTWLCTILVVHTLVSWVRFWREMVWRVIEKQDAEYDKAKKRTIQGNEQTATEEKMEEEEKIEVKRERSLWMK